MLSKSIFALLLSAQIIVGPGSGGSGGGGSSTTIINNNYNNVTNTTGTFISEGCQVVWLTGYQYSASACSYFIVNSNYVSAEQTVTLDAAHATLNRLDVIALDNTGTLVKITGTAAADPAQPSIDPGTQIPLVIVLVTANTTSPPAVVEGVLYFDAAGGPTEWNWTTSGSCFVTNSTSNPKSPATHDIEGTACASGAYAQGQIPSSTINVNSYGLLALYIRSKATWTNNRGLQVQFLNAGVTVGQPVVINPTNTWGFNSTITGSYQQVAIPVTNFSIPNGTLATQIRISKFGSGSNIGMYIGDISLQGSAVVPTPTIVPSTCANGQVLFNANSAIDCEAALTYTKATDTLALTGPLNVTGLVTITGSTSFTGGQYNVVPVAHGTSGTTETLDFSAGNTHTLTLDENITLTFSNPVDGGRYIVIMRQDGSGTNVVTWPSTVEWPNGDVAPTFSTTANHVNLCTFYYVSAVTNYYGACNVQYVE